ncbi:MAG: RNA polymerase sigma-70 factor [Gordonia sp. (in: high G+C Gram-positive bacteria)]
MTAVGGSGDEAHAARFAELRPVLFTLAYEILGSATDADDVLQESYLRWRTVDVDSVENTRAYLAAIVTRQALNLLRTAARRRETYVGPWLPEPILLDERDAATDVVLAESVSMAMLVVLETLGPDERVVFVLREVFGFGHDEIADILGKSTANIRQIAHRARAHVQARRPRFAPVDRQRAHDILGAFVTAAASGSVEQLVELLAPDVVYTADSDGKASAPRRPVVGADRVAMFFTGLMRIAGDDVEGQIGIVNAMPGIVFSIAGRIEGVFVFDIVDGTVVNIFTMRNPDKLAGIAMARAIGR